MKNLETQEKILTVGCEQINDESTADCRKRMGTRRGNSIVTARASLARARPMPSSLTQSGPDQQEDSSGVRG